MHSKFMEQAIAISREMMKANQGGPFGAVIVHEGKVIATGHNQVTSTNDPTAHAEIVAIREACRKLEAFHLEDCDLYTSCEPCPMCLSAMYWARLRKVYYANTREDAAAIGFDDDFIYREIPLPLEQRKLPMEPLLRERAGVAFQEWMQKPDKVAY